MELILGCVAAGMNFDEILEEYPPLTRDDLRAAVSYAVAMIPGPKMTDWDV